ncbi:hypothetical protein [Enterocloster sp.]
MVRLPAIHHIHGNMPPLFIQHGSRDQILPMQQSVSCHEGKPGL